MLLSSLRKLRRVLSMIQIGEIDHVVLRAGDMSAMQRFYCDVLGCSEERRQDDIGLVQLRAGTSLIDLVWVNGKLGQLGGRAPADEGHNMDHVCLRVENYDESVILAHLKAHDVRIGELGLRYGARGMGAVDLPVRSGGQPGRTERACVQMMIVNCIAATLHRPLQSYALQYVGRRAGAM
jgi:glyoxylase I family protein